MMKQFFFLIMIACLFHSCVEKTSSWSIDKAVQVKLNESEIVLRSMPRRLRVIDDSTVVMITNHQQLSLYNLFTGNNIGNFSASGIHFDSLVDITYNEYYKGRRHYIYDSANAGGVTEGTYQMSDYAQNKGKYYIYLSCETEVKY